MNNSTKSNIYEFNALKVLSEYRGFIEGEPNDTLLVISENGASDAAENAIVRSAETIGYGMNACAWITLQNDDRSGKQLEAQDLYHLVEGMDPVAVVVLDRFSCDRFLEAYRDRLNASEEPTDEKDALSDAQSTLSLQEEARSGGGAEVGVEMHAGASKAQEDRVEMVFGRRVALFGDLDSLLASQEGKQAAWRLLKELAL